MQHATNKIEKFKEKLGKVIKTVREKSDSKSQNAFAMEYDIDRGNLSRLENGKIGCNIMTAWRITEGAGIKFSEFAKMLEDELGEDFKLMDE